MKIILALMFSGLSLPAISKAAGKFNHFQYSVRIAGSSEGCASEAKALASAFAKFDKNLKNVTGDCVSTSHLQESGQSYALDSLSVDYDSLDDQAIVPFTVTLQRDVTSGINSTVIYSSYRDCLTDIAQQEASFVAATGLSVLAASCEPEGSDVAYGYKMILAGLGDSKRSLYQFANSANDSLTTDGAWAAQIEGVLKSKHAMIAKRVAEVYFYYAPEQIPLVSQTLITTLATGDCETQRPRAEALLKTLGANVIISGCHTGQYGISLDVIGNIFGLSTTDYGAGSAVYYDFASCMADLHRLDHQSDANGDKTSLRFCAVNDDNPKNYDIVAFETRSY